jgi:hypothetical protein
MRLTSTGPGTLALLLAVTVSATGCGDNTSSTERTSARGSATVPSRPVSTQRARNMPLGLTRAELTRRLGPPERMIRPDGREVRCAIYQLADQADGVGVQFCFRKDRLTVVASYIR